MLTIVIGAGPSGLCAAFSSANNNNQVIVIEKNNKVGKTGRRGNDEWNICWQHQDVSMNPFQTRSSHCPAEDSSL